MGHAPKCESDLPSLPLILVISFIFLFESFIGVQFYTIFLDLTLYNFVLKSLSCVVYRLSIFSLFIVVLSLHLFCFRFDLSGILKDFLEGWVMTWQFLSSGCRRMDLSQYRPSVLTMLKLGTSAKSKRYYIL